MQRGILISFFTDPTLAGPSIPTRGMLISTFFFLNSWVDVRRSVYSYSAWIQPRSGTSRSAFRKLLRTRYIHTHHHSAPSTIFTPGGSLATDPYHISGPGPSTVTQDEPIGEVMRPDKSDGPDSHSCSCLLVWNSVKDYWERLYGWVVYSITKLLKGMLLSVVSLTSVRAQGGTFIFVVGRFWRLCSIFILPGMPVWIRRLKPVDWSVIHPRCALTM